MVNKAYHNVRVRYRKK